MTKPSDYLRRGWCKGQQGVRKGEHNQCQG